MYPFAILLAASMSFNMIVVYLWYTLYRILHSDSEMSEMLTAINRRIDWKLKNTAICFDNKGQASVVCTCCLKEVLNDLEPIHRAREQR